jgi:hypothetical protein
MRLLSFTLLAATLLPAQAIRPNAGFNQNFVARNDDGSSSAVSLGFTVNFFGKLRSSAFVNNNGNITFDSALATFTPFGLTSTQREIIAPFFADVDTRNATSEVVRYGRDEVNGRPAFGVNWINVGYFSSRADKLNSFQLVLIERSDIGPNDFDIEFNYGRISWETGDASGGTDGFGGTPAAVGYSNGTGEDGTFFEWPGSLVPGALLDSGPRALIRARLNSQIPGRITFRARGGTIQPALTITTGVVLPDATVGQPYRFQLSSIGGAAPFRWSWTPDVTPPPGVTLNADGSVTGTPTQSGSYSVTISLTARTEDGDQTVTRRTTLNIRPPSLNILTGCPLPTATVGRPYAQTLRGSGAASLAWSVVDPLSLPPGLTLTPGGTLAGTPVVEGIYTFIFQAASTVADSSQPVRKPCRVEVRPSEIRISQACVLTPATVGVPYAAALAAEGGSAPYRYRALSNLPQGLTLDAAGRIAGTPLASGTYNFRIEGSDSRNQTFLRDCWLDTNEPGFQISGCPLPQGFAGQDYSGNLTATGGAGSYVFTVSGTLPPGVTLRQDGTLGGTPGRSGSFGFRVLASDAQGRQAAQACNLTVLPTPVGISSCLPDGAVGEPYQRVLTTTGGEEPFLWSPAGGFAPGLTLSASGNATGVPTQAGQFPYTLQVRDNRGATAQRACVLNVRGQSLRIQTLCPLPQATLGATYSQRLEPAGGQPPYRIRYFGNLAPGLNLTEQGLLSGRPSQLGSTDFLLELTDAADGRTLQACSLETALPALPTIRLTGIPATVPAATTTLQATVQLSAPYTEAIQGEFVLDVQPNTASTDASANQPDPRARFLNGSNRIRFTIPAGATRASAPIATSGTIASFFELRAENLRAAGTELPPLVSPLRFEVPRSGPVLSSACYTVRENALDFTLTGFSSTRELYQASVIIDDEDPRTFDLAGPALAYFSSDATVRTGSAFTVLLTVPYQFTPRSASIQITNYVGRTDRRSVSRCQ